MNPMVSFLGVAVGDDVCIGLCFGTADGVHRNMSVQLLKNIYPGDANPIGVCPLV